MNKELKPCIHLSICYQANEFGCTWNTCKDYITEKPESAWEMFRKLIKKNVKLYRICDNKNVECDESIKLECIFRGDAVHIEYCLLKHNEQEAIKIMHYLEKELIDE